MQMVSGGLLIYLKLVQCCFSIFPLSVLPGIHQLVDGFVVLLLYLAAEG